ncbi:MAG: NAD(P)-binding protein [Micromonosporaceae bacterium]|nr:NAD(P)-binding protein [Micromonosporaceae bacterium]
MTETPFAITLPVGSSLANKTGAWRTRRPGYVTLLPPCAKDCPAGQNPRGWLTAAEEADYERAWRLVMAVNPFPAVIGRVCYHPCQTACNRCQVDEPVGINAVERFIGDEGLRRKWTVPVAAPTGRRVLVVGAGPSGLTAAYHLTRLGHQVVVRDANPQPGGMMRYGIPRYRLPREVLDAEIDRILAMGVTLECGRSVTDLRQEIAEGSFDAGYVAVGAQIGRHAEIPAGDAGRIVDALGVLHRVAEGEPVRLGRRVLIYGGGDTAMDAARTARRIGATEAVVVYRRTRDRMPAHEIEVDQAQEEGISLRWLSTISAVDGERVVIEKMRLDDTGFPQPTGEFEELAADSVVLALGQQADLSLLDSTPEVAVRKGTVEVGPGLMTGRPGVFAGGDITAGEQTVTQAIGDGTRAAAAIDAYLRTAGWSAPPEPALATVDRLNTWYYSDAPASVAPRLTAARRATTFDEVVGGLDRETALFEARRCMSCGDCFECDNCYSVCPDNAIVKLGPGHRYTINLDYCKGCGLCATECPCGAIDMVNEQV